MLTNKQISLIILLISLVGLIGTMKYDWNLFQIAGFSTLSLQKVDFVSNDPTLQRSAWLLTVSVNGQGQKAIGTISSNQLVDEQDNVKATNDLTISVSIDKHEARYPIQATNKKFYKLNYEKRTYWFGIGANDFENECKSKPNFYRFAKQAYTWDYYCITTTQDAIYGLILNPTIGFESTISLQSGSKTVSTKISNIGQTSAWLDNIAYVTWQGNLVSGETPPSPSQYKIAAAYSGNFIKAWRIIDDMKAQEYFNYHISGFDSCVTGGNSIETCVNEYNTIESNALAGKDFVYNGVVAKTYGDINNGQVVLELSKLLQFPVLTFHIDAEWIGIQIPVGKPKIIQATSQEFQVGSTGYITLTVKNVGTGLGSFAVALDLPQGFSLQGTTPTFNLNPNEQKTINIPILASSTKDISGRAGIKVYERNNPIYYDTATVWLSAKKLIFCKDGDLRVNGNVIEICVNGNEWQIYKRCGSDEVAVIEQGQAKCVKKSEYKPSIFESFASWIGGFFQSAFDLMRNIFAIFGIVVFAIVILFLLNFFGIVKLSIFRKK